MKNIGWSFLKILKIKPKISCTVFLAQNGPLCTSAGGCCSYSVRSSTRGGTTNRTGSWEAKLALIGGHGAPFLLASSISSQFVRLIRKVNKWNFSVKSKWLFEKLKFFAVCFFLCGPCSRSDVKKYARSWIIQNEIPCDNRVNFSRSRAEIVYSLGRFDLSR